MKALNLGLAEYTATNFNGEMTGDLVTASFDGTIKRMDLAADGTTVLGVTTLATPPGIPLDVTQGPGGSAVGDPDRLRPDPGPHPFFHQRHCRS